MEKRISQSVDDAVRESLDSLLSSIADEMETADSAKRDVISIYSPMVYLLDNIVRDCLERKKSKCGLNDKLCVILDTTGGFVTPVERMVDTIRYHYKEVDFIIPDMAMSAGTIFALSGDRIWMDYFSVLGPIDPQVKKDDRFVPALSYILQYERLVELSKTGQLTQAHAVLLQKLDLAELDQFNQERELSITLLRKWLTDYKFKNWDKTENSGREVTHDEKVNRAEEIATILNNTEKWHTHSRGINKESLENDVHLKIDDFSKNVKLQSSIRNYHQIMKDYQLRNNQHVFVYGKDMY